jgi:hypothetical protein
MLKEPSPGMLVTHCRIEMEEMTNIIESAQGIFLPELD